jgi:hypothetical protein
MEELVEDLRMATFHMNNEEAKPVIDDFLFKYPQLLTYHEKEWYYINC